MRWFFMLLSALVALFAIGCNECEPGDECWVDPLCHGDECDDTGEPDGEASLTYRLFYPSGEEASDAEVVFVSETDSMDIVETAKSGETIYVPAPAKYRVSFGNDAISSDGHNVHVDNNGVPWILAAYQVQVHDEDNLSDNKVYNRYYSGNDVVCYHKLDYSDEWTETDEGAVDVTEGYKLKLRALGTNSWLEFNGTDVDIGGDLSEYFYITSIEMEVNTLYFTYKADGSPVAEVNCQF